MINFIIVLGFLLVYTIYIVYMYMYILYIYNIFQTGLKESLRVYL